MDGVTTAGGVPDYSSSGTPKFSPALYSGKMVEKFYAATAFGEIATTDYEGDIVGFGDNVVIRTVPDVAVSDYIIGQGLNRQRPSSTAVTLSINKAKTFSVALNRVQARQSDLDLAEVFSTEGTKKTKIAADKDILGNIFTQVDAANQGATAGALSGDINLGAAGSPVALTSDNMTQYLTYAGQVLDEQDLPDEDRWIVLPSSGVRALKNSDLKVASLAGDGESILRNGKVGMVDRFMIYQSNNLTLTTDGSDKVWNMPFGHKSSLTFAAQITELRMIDDPDDFGWLIDGLLVYGYKVIAPKYMGWLYGKVSAT